MSFDENGRAMASNSSDNRTLARQSRRPSEAYGSAVATRSSDNRTLSKASNSYDNRTLSKASRSSDNRTISKLSRKPSEDDEERRKDQSRKAFDARFKERLELDLGDPDFADIALDELRKMGFDYGDHEIERATAARRSRMPSAAHEYGSRSGRTPAALESGSTSGSSSKPLGFRGSIKQSIRRKLGGSDENTMQPARGRQKASSPDWMYIGPNDNTGRILADPPPRAHGWQRIWVGDGGADQRKAESYSPERGGGGRGGGGGRDHVCRPSNAHRESFDNCEPCEPRCSGLPSNYVRLPDHYKTLGIPYRASLEDCRVAAKKRRVEVHPDTMRRDAARKGMKLTQKNEEDIERVAKEVGEAAHVLADAGRRIDYNLQLMCEREYEWEPVAKMGPNGWVPL